MPSRAARLRTMSRVVEIDGVPAAVGDHVCVFYRGDEQRRRTVARFLAEGAAAGDDCLVITSDDDRAWLAAVPEQALSIPAVRSW